MDTLADYNAGEAEMRRIVAAKEERRRRLATLSFPEKVRIVVHLQRMATPLWRTHGKNVAPWDLELGD